MEPVMKQSRQNHMRTVCVSFSGVDGAGKSTQIDALRRRMLQGGMRVRVIAFWDEVAQLTGLREGAGHTVFKGEKGVGSPEKPANRRDKNVRSWPMTLVRLGFYLLDAIAVRTTTSRVRNGAWDFIIFDRYIYDEFANLPLENPLVRTYVRLLMKLTPRPDISFILDADPAKARARKPEYPLDFIHINRKAYLSLDALLGKMTVIPPSSIEEAEMEVLGHVLRLLPSSNEAAATTPVEAESSPVA